MESNGNGNGKRKPGGVPGNLGNRTLKEQEKEARRRADELLNMETENSVRVLVAIRDAPDSTNFDKRACAEAILDRKIPKMTQERLLLQDARRTLLEIPNLGWPPPVAKVVESGGE